VRFEWKFHAFVLMDTHYHFLLEVEEDALQPGMHALNSGYGRQFNLRHGRSGHLKGSPYGSRLIETDAHFLSCVRYIARNPLEAGLCENPADWSWGSYRGSAGYDDGFPFVTNDFVLSCFHEDVAKARQLLRLFVETP
jgi:hypothetical protein